MDSPANRYILATWFRRLTPTIVICTAGRTPAASPDHHQGHLLVEAARFYSQLTKWDDRFDGTAPYRVPHLLYAPFPFEAEIRQCHGSFVVDVTSTFEQKMEAIAATPRNLMNHGSLKCAILSAATISPWAAVAASLTASFSHCRR